MIYVIRKNINNHNLLQRSLPILNPPTTHSTPYVNKTHIGVRHQIAQVVSIQFLLKVFSFHLNEQMMLNCESE